MIKKSKDWPTLVLKIFISALLGFATSASAKPQYQDVVTGLDNPWAMEFLPNGDILVTERPGKLRLVRDGQLLTTPIAGVPHVYYAGQGGLLDVQLDQDFASNQIIYLSLAHGIPNANATRLIRSRLQDMTLVEQEVLFTAQPLKATPQHYAGRILQLADKSLILSVGDGYQYREAAQTLDNHLGKLVRVNADGSIPEDNPFANEEQALKEIWSFGHRNHQGLAILNGKLYANEHGPRGGDEINLIEKGLNYGWPVTTKGIDYTGARISPFTEYSGMQPPLVDWTPSIAPSSMAEHQGALYVSSLAEKSIRRVVPMDHGLKDTGIVFPELAMRVREIVSGPDGYLYVLTDGDDAKIIRIVD